MNERLNQLAFGLAWLIGIAVLGWFLPHAKIATQIASVLGANPNTVKWVGFVLGLLSISGLGFWLAMRVHVTLRDRESEDSVVFIDRISSGLVWSLFTFLVVEFVFALSSTGGTGTLRAYVFDLVRGKFIAKTLLFLAGTGVLVLFVLISNRAIWTMFSKEFKIYFSTPILYTLLVLFCFLIGFQFSKQFDMFLQYSTSWIMRHKQQANVNLNQHVFYGIYGFFSVVLLFLVPLITMRLLAEEKQRNTYQLLMTAPITTFEIVMSKFLSAFIAIATIIAVTFVYPVLVGIVTPGSFEWGPVMTSYFGLFLLAGAFAAIGLFFSSLTENQIIAAALCFVLLLLLWLVERFALGLSDGWLRQTVEFLSILGHLKNFFLGVVETKDIVYYLSVMFLGNSLAYLMVEGQRWR